MTAKRPENIVSNSISSDPGAGSHPALLCPACGSDNLHHCGVTVFDRAEDAEQVTRTRVMTGVIESHIVDNSDANPSSRRDGMVIDFECEICTAKPIQLRLAQHKGITLIWWAYTTHPEREGYPDVIRPSMPKTL